MRRDGLARRLAATQLVVLASMGLAVAGAALVVGPPLFSGHMRASGHDMPGVAEHARQAFHDAGLLSLAIGLVVAVPIAVATSWAMNRRLVRGIDALIDGAARLSAGEAGHRVDVGRSLPELAAVADEFNEMAARLAATEATRRRLLTDLGHELRTPLSVTRVTLEAVADGVVEPGPETLELLLHQNERLAALARDISLVSAAEEGRIGLDLAAVDVDALVAACGDGFGAAADRAGVRLDVSATSGATVTGDARRLAQVLDNLVRNALQHTPAGGRVTVAATGGSGPVHIEVCDDGEGIAAGDLPHLFERFYRVDGSRVRDTDGGTGVGLAISRAIVAQHGGTLTAHSDGPGRGARFVVELPAGGTDA